MKKCFIGIAVLLLLSAAMSAQEKIFLFDDFKPAVFLMKRHVKTTASFNFDAKGQGVYFIQNEEIMELTNASEIDTVYVDGRKFVWRNECLCEYIDAEYGEIYVNWRLRDSFVGKEGAFGTTTQGKVEVIQVPGINSEYSSDNIGRFSDRTDVWTVKNENVYFLFFQGKEYRIRRQSDLTRAFPDKSKDIKRFLKEHNYTLNSAEQVKNTLDYICTGKEPESKR